MYRYHCLKMICLVVCMVVLIHAAAHRRIRQIRCTCACFMDDVQRMQAPYSPLEFGGAFFSIIRQGIDRRACTAAHIDHGAYTRRMVALKNGFNRL